MPRLQWYEAAVSSTSRHACRQVSGRFCERTQDGVLEYLLLFVLLLCANERIGVTAAAQPVLTVVFALVPDFRLCCPPLFVLHPWHSRRVVSVCVFVCECERIGERKRKRKAKKERERKRKRDRERKRKMIDER